MFIYLRCAASKCRSCLSKSLVSFITRSASAYKVVELKKRSVFKLVGPQTFDLLQGLVTNDVNLLKSNSSSIYALFLNSKGRVIQDSIIYRDPSGSDVLMVECDSSGFDSLQKHVQTYRLKKKVDIIPLDEELAVWAAFKDHGGRSDNAGFKETIMSKPLGKDVLVSEDPRLSLLGYRILAPKHVDLSKLMKEQGIEVEKDTELLYKMLRYRLGIGEGMEEIPSGQCFPLEVNSDYLNGVSFDKGCYIGQELTARTHHTGVVRKRLMPVYLDVTPEQEEELSIPYDTPIESGDSPKPIGKLKATVKNIGIALLRISEAQSVDHFRIGDKKAHTRRPEWWPDEQKNK